MYKNGIPENFIPEGVGVIIKTLEDAGFEAYAVGGCVRDSLIGRIPADWDITTSALPGEVKKLFRRTVDTGIKHGTVTVLMKEKGRLSSYEVTTYRVDGEYEDGRHPKEVSFTASLEEDLKRRDFTINAMAWHPERGLVDLFGGTEDLKQNVIRCVGEASERFSEDALRMMRAVRFAAQLGGSIDEATVKAIKEHAEDIEKVSAERIRTEAEKLLVSDHPAMFRLFYEYGLTKHFLPEFDACMTTEQETPHHCYTVGEHILHSLENINTAALKEEAKEAYDRELKVLRISMLLHDIAKPLMKTVDENGICHFKGHPKKSAEMADEILKRLKYDNDTINRVKKLIEFHDDRTEADRRLMRRFVNRAGREAFPLIFYVQEADVLSQSTYKREEKLSRLYKIHAMWREIEDNEECVDLSQLAVKGADLIAAGVNPGPVMGELLTQMLKDVLEEPEHNTKEYLLKTYVGKE
ncbi:MAG: CCA tRNA nucleotidyltransferase [Lachnospiraceae bacterium]|nr:CCA tRNA nucleotidyltransferase [Lachnospiraceae bacterium]